MKNYIYFVVWLISIIVVSLWTFENPEKIELIKNIYKKNKNPEIKSIKEKTTNVSANSFVVSYENIFSFSDKTAFISYDDIKEFYDPKLMKIYTQNGNLFSNFKSKKMNLPKSFTLQRNGGVKTIFSINEKVFALISNTNGKCFYASIVNVSSGKEVFKSNCLPGKKKKIDFNGLGASNIHLNNNVYLSIGTPTQNSKLIYELAQNNESIFGKIIEISKSSLDIKPIIFSSGHRNPQGLTKLNNKIFSVEHGPKGGDELNLISKEKNYGWPIVSYGTRYMYDSEGKSYSINHELNNFEEPLFALVPSVGISSINNCPKILKNFYQKNCLIALSLYGNNLRPGKSILIYLLNDKLDKVHSIEKIYLGNDMKLRHFVTNKKNELFEDEYGNIYVSVDLKGIFKISFSKFR